MDSYVALHVHSQYSMLDGAAQIGPLLDEVVRLGQPAVALTDHGNTYGAAEFYRVAKETGVTPVCGIEAYVAPGSRFHKKPVFWGTDKQSRKDEFGMGGDVSGAGAFTHMTLLAMGATGLRNLFRLSSRASFEGTYRKPRMDRDLLSQHSEGIIATTGCPSGEVQTRLRLGQRREAMQAASDWRDIFGEGNLYLELMDHGLAIERSVREGLLEIGRALNLPPLATNDSHYVTQGHATAHAALLCVQSDSTLAKPKFAFDGDGYYLKSAEEMRGYWDKEVPRACDNTLLVASRVESYDEVFAPVNRIPHVPLQPGDTEDAMLRREVRRLAAERFPNGLPAEYQARADFELDVITQMGFAGYHLVVADLAGWMHEQGIRYRARGSAVGSLIAYLLRISDVNPMDHGLMFERYLNPDRVSPADIDLDVDELRRGDVLNYLVRRWGEGNVAQVITFGTIKTRAAIRDATRVLGHEYAVGERIIKALPPAVYAEDVPLAGAFDPSHDRYQDAGALRELVESDRKVAEVVATARGLEGLVRSAGVHASAVIVSSQPLLDVLPLWKRDDGSIITGWDGPTCENIGLIKFDVLGLTTLTVLDTAVRAIRDNHKVNLDLHALTLDDKATYELLASGHTTGVFQLDGQGARDVMRRIAPTKFGDISAALALYRPGPMGAGAHTAYGDCKNGRQEIRPVHPELADALADVLSETYGRIVYQEDVMAIARKLAGYTLSGADILRRAMGKKKKEVLDGEREKFAAGMRANGYSQDAIDALWNLLVPFCSYGFGRSHTASFAIVAYWTAYLKTHYPAEFLAARLTSLGNEKDKTGVYLAECRRMGITVLPPDVNASGLGYTAVVGSPVSADPGPLPGRGAVSPPVRVTRRPRSGGLSLGAIRFGLSAIRDVGAGTAEAIIVGRQGARYESFQDFLTRVEPRALHKQAIKALILAGAFDSFGHPRQALHDVSDEAVDAVAAWRKREAAGLVDMFGAAPLERLKLGSAEWPSSRLLAAEREVLGLYVSAHPLDGAEGDLRAHAPQSIAELRASQPKGVITIAGMISTVKTKTGKQGEWASVIVEDLEDSIEVLVFAKAYTLLRDRLVPDTVVTVKGKSQWREDVLSVVAWDIQPVDLATVPVMVRLELADCTERRVAELREILTRHPGDREVRLTLINGERRVPLRLTELRVTPSDELARELGGLLPW